MAELRALRDLVEPGEKAVASALLSLDEAWVVVPQLTLPGQSWALDPDDLDWVVLGPTGLHLVSYHHWQGVVEAAPGRPWAHRFPGGGLVERPNPASALEAKRAALEAFLGERGLSLPGPLQAWLVFPERTPVLAPEHVPQDLHLAGLHQLVQALQAGPRSAWEVGPVADHLRPASTPKMVNQYRLTAVLSRSEVKVTHLAFDTALERPVLIQELPYDPYAQPAALDRIRHELLREAKLTAQLRHPNVIHVAQVIPRDDCYYVVTEWLPGAESLALGLQRRPGPWPVEEAQAIVLAVGEALAHAHAQGVVHRDVRPENIVVAPEVVKVANFGLAKGSDVATRSTFDLRQMAQENPYVAPEFKLGASGPHQVDQRLDVYALGVLAYRLLTGKLPPHLDESYFEPPSAARPELGTTFDRVVEKMLRFDPAQRFPTMEAALEAWRRPPGEHGPGQRYTQRKLAKRTRNALIFKAWDEHSSREVALKRLLLEPTLAGEARRAELGRVLREAQLAATLVHPHIVAAFDHFVEDGDGHVVMEWIEGRNLREWQEAGERLSHPQIRAVAEQVGEALHHAHGQGVIHRDVKPENIIFHEGQATILDFGIAAPPGEVKGAGTARYMAPEVLRGEGADARADVFGLAVVLYELLTAQFPYEGAVVLGRYSAVMAAPPQRPSDLEPSCPVGLDAVMARALAIDLDRRTPSMAEFVRDFVHHEGKASGRPSVRNPLEASPRAGKGWLLLAGLMVVLFGLVATATHRVLTGLGGAMGSPSPLHSNGLPSPVLSPEPTALPSPTPSPTPAALPSPSPELPAQLPGGMVGWQADPVVQGGVAMEWLALEVQAQQTRLRFRIRNGNPKPLAFLTHPDKIEEFSLVDDVGHQYAGALEPGSVDAAFWAIAPMGDTEAGFTLKEALSAQCEQVVLRLVEVGELKLPFELVAKRLPHGAVLNPE